MIGPPSGDMDNATGSNAFAEGLEERARGGPRSSCPYPEGSGEWRDWMDGWDGELFAPGSAPPHAPDGSV
jgi:hypothetical protein